MSISLTNALFQSAHTVVGAGQIKASLKLTLQESGVIVNETGVTPDILNLGNRGDHCVTEIRLSLPENLRDGYNIYWIVDLPDQLYIQQASMQGSGESMYANLWVEEDVTFADYDNHLEMLFVAIETEAAQNITEETEIFVSSTCYGLVAQNFLSSGWHIGTVVGDDIVTSDDSVIVDSLPGSSDMPESYSDMTWVNDETALNAYNMNNIMLGIKEAHANKQDKLVAGSNITIAEDQKTISATVSYPVTDIQVDGSTVLDGTVARITMPTLPTKESLGLDNVDNTSDADKPISTATQTALNEKQNIITDLESIRAGAAKGESAVQSADLAAVATSGSYDDLVNKLTFDTEPTENSTNPVTSGGIYAALGGNYFDIEKTTTEIQTDPISGTFTADEFTKLKNSNCIVRFHITHNNTDVALYYLRFKTYMPDENKILYCMTASESSSSGIYAMYLEVTQDETDTSVYNYILSHSDTTESPSGSVNYLTTAPTADNTDGDLKFVVLDSEPETKYDGYYYLITE